MVPPKLRQLIKVGNKLWELYLWNKVSCFLIAVGVGGVTCFGSVTILIVINEVGYHSGKTFRSLSERQLLCLNFVCLVEAA